MPNTDLKKRVLYALGATLLLLCVGLLIWQGSFSFGDYGPGTPEQTLLVWSVSSAVVLLTLILGWMLIRSLIKLYLERLANREGSQIRTKLVIGALMLTLLPVGFLVFFSVQVMNRNLDKWFSKPQDTVRNALIDMSLALQAQNEARTRATAMWVAGSPEMRILTATGTVDASWRAICDAHSIHKLDVHFADGRALAVCSPAQQPTTPKQIQSATVPVREAVSPAEIHLETLLPFDIAERLASVEAAIFEQNALARSRKDLRTFYIRLLLLITLFILFFAVWMALYFARRISEPIAALLEAAREVRGGNLNYFIQTPGTDEMATLIRAFNEMTRDIDTNRREVESRQRFVEAILENIPTGVISLAADGQIQTMNRALRNFIAPEVLQRARTLSDLFSGDDLLEIRYLINRARRTRIASNQIDLAKDGRTFPVNIVVSALEDHWRLNFIVVLEDTSEVLRIQRMEAWQEVARRVAHEIKNPLTPIALSAERIVRQLERSGSHTDAARIIRECAATINEEVGSLKSLVDEFAQAARFPTVNLSGSDLNEVIGTALNVFDGRLSGISVRTDLEPNLPLIALDREQFKRVLVNLIDNAAEAMESSAVKQLLISTRSLSAETVELAIADTGSGVSPDDKEKLFLPYYTTKIRGTGLGLSIVSHILIEHRGSIRVEDNQPAGATFIIELPVYTPAVEHMPA